MKESEKFLMNFISGGGEEEGTAFLQAMVCYLDFHILTRAFLERRKKEGPMTDAVIKECTAYHRKTMEGVNLILSLVHGLSFQEQMRAAKRANQKSDAERNLSELVRYRNRISDILADYSHVPDRLKTILVLEPEKGKKNERKHDV